MRVLYTQLSYLSICMKVVKLVNCTLQLLSLLIPRISKLTIGISIGIINLKKLTLISVNFSILKFLPSIQPIRNSLIRYFQESKPMLKPIEEEEIVRIRKVPGNLLKLFLKKVNKTCQNKTRANSTIDQYKTKINMSKIKEKEDGDKN